MVDVCELTKFTASGKVLRLVMDIAAALGISRSAIQKHIAHLKDAQRLRRIGPDKGGRWEVAYTI